MRHRAIVQIDFLSNPIDKISCKESDEAKELYEYQTDNPSQDGCGSEFHRNFFCRQSLRFLCRELLILPNENQYSKSYN